MFGFLTPPPDIRQPVIVMEDHGGIVAKYQGAALRYNLENRRVEIRGRCSSACTLALGVKNVCVGKAAMLYWHHAFNEHDHATRYDITREMLSQIPFRVAQTVGPYISVDYNDKATLNYAQLLRLGIPDCDSYTQTVQASVTTMPPAPKSSDPLPSQAATAQNNSPSIGNTVNVTPATVSNVEAAEIDQKEQRLLEFDATYNDALTISTRQHGVPAILKNCDARRCEEIAAYYDRRGHYVELHKSLNGKNRVICRLSREGLFEDDYKCLNWLTGQRLAYHWSREPLY